MASFKYHPIVNPAFIAIVLAGFGTAAWAIEFAGGTGALNDPYQIVTPEQLVGMGQEPSLWNRHFVLVADIDLDPNLPGGAVRLEGTLLSRRTHKSSI
jgi:hypothetical protein